MDTPKEMSVAIDIDDPLTEMEEIQVAAIPSSQSETDHGLVPNFFHQAATIPRSQSETPHGMSTSKVKGELKTFVKKWLDELPVDEFYDPIGGRTIFRLPNHELKKELCEPKLVSIGPYHRGKQSLLTMEQQKWFMLRGFLKRNEKVGCEDYLNAMKELEPRARLSYSEPVNLKIDDFALMLLLDGCFILEWLFLLRDGYSRYGIFNTGWINVEDIFYDLYLMENQVPFNVIHTLWVFQDQGVGGSPCCKSEVEDQTCPLVKLVSSTFRKLNLGHLFNFNPIDSRSCSCSGIVHLLHLFCDQVTSECASPQTTSTEQARDSPACFPCSKLFPKSFQAASDSSQQTQSDHAKSHNVFSSDCLPCSKSYKAASDPKKVHVMCVSELCDAGVKFKKKKNPKHMLDISFEKGIFKMPFLKIDGHFVRILWNLVAYEQTVVGNFGTKTLILSSYLALTDSLIKTEKDVAILERAGIVDNYFSNEEEAAVFFSQFGKLFLLSYDYHHFFCLSQDVKTYSESTWAKNRATLVQRYFSSPWAIISVGAAGVLFVLTILQTYYSAMSV